MCPIFHSSDEVTSHSGRKSAAENLRVFTNLSNDIHRQYLEDTDVLDRYQAFISWQNNYMSGFFEDFRQLKETAAAVDFVISDLTGIGISARDHDLARVVPAMVRLLPDKALQAVAVAMELNSRILKINLSICHDLFQGIDNYEKLNERDYCVACRNVSSLGECLDLVWLTRRVGFSLDQIVEVPMIGVTLRAMRFPARLAGFGVLQDFLETGYRTFREIDDVEQFLDDISARTASVFTRIFEEPEENLGRI